MRAAASPGRVDRGATKGCPPPRHFEFSAGLGRHRVWGVSFLSHQGLTVNLVGGDVPHIGAVAVSIPRPSLAQPGRRSATTSVFALVGHKEDELARPLATNLARALGLTTVVVAGVRIHRARAADVLKVFENAGRALQAIIHTIRTEPGLSLSTDDSDDRAFKTRRRSIGRRKRS
jgi:gallate decarboxylase subunit D